MNKRELDQFLKTAPKRRSKYEKYKDEIQYLYDNDATLDAILDFLFQKYQLKRTKTTLHSYIKRNIANKSDSQSTQSKTFASLRKSSDDTKKSKEEPKSTSNEENEIPRHVVDVGRSKKLKI